jgi:uncharacterized protein (TIGR00661 family)
MNILYGVPGEGMGHATRSKVIIDYLLQRGHQVKIVASSRAFTFLDKNFPGKVVEIKGFHFAYKDAEVSKLKIFTLNIKDAPKNFIYNLKKEKLIIQNFKTDLVISDFESFSYLFARKYKLPIISIDNMQVMNRCGLDIDIANEEKNNFLLAKQIVKAKVPGCDQYLISSFFEADIIKKNTQLVPPIIRQAILNAKTSTGKHILMYQTSSSLKTVQQVLQQLPNETFYVYGMNKDFTEGNVVFKSFSEKGFIDDLSSARAVIANGGFSFISEAVYLKKPVYSFPIHNQFEQWMNAAYIQKLGYGRHFDSLNADHLKSFLYDINVFENNLSVYKQNGNEKLFSVVEATIKSLSN